MATWSSELALPGQLWEYEIEVEGWGWLLNAVDATHAEPFKFSTIYPGSYGLSAAADVDLWEDLLRRPSGVIGEELDLREGRASLGSLNVELLDGNLRTTGGTDSGWSATSGLLTQLLMVQAASSQWSLNGDIDPFPTIPGTTTFWPLVSAAGIIVGQILYCGAEAVRVTSVAGAPTIQVVRAVQGTRVQRHYRRTSLPGTSGEGIVYSRPQYVRGRKVVLYARPGDSTKEPKGLLATGQRTAIWRGIIDDWEQAGPNVYRLMLRAALGRLHKRIGREQFVARTIEAPSSVAHGGEYRLTPSGEGRWRVDTVTPEVQAFTPADALAADEQIDIIVETETGDGIVRQPEYPPDGSSLRQWTARWGDELLWAVSAEPAAITDPCRIVTIYRWKLLRLPPAPPNMGDEIRDVLWTSPAAYGATPNPCRYFRCVDATSPYYCDPVGIALALITSTGTSVRNPAWAIGTNGEWDCLPEHWSAGVPAAEMDTASFRAVAQRISNGIRLPNLIIGWDGRPESLSDLLEREILGPFGVFLIQGATGLIAAGMIGEYYPGDAWTVLDSGAILPRTAMLVGDLQQTLTWQTWSYDWDWHANKPRQVRRYRHPQAYERGQEDDSEVTRTVRGLAHTQEAAAHLADQATAFAQQWVTPWPRIKLSVSFAQIELPLTTGVLITEANLPNPLTGTRGVTSLPAAIVRRDINLDKACIDLELICVAQRHVGLIPPSALCLAWNLGLLRMTCQANIFTPLNSADTVPNRDVSAFTSGVAGVGDMVMIVDSRGVPQVDVARRVTSIDAVNDYIYIDAGWTMGGAPVSPVGHYVEFCHWTGGAVPASAWTTTQQYCVALADEATGLLPNGSAAYVYGGT